MAAAVIVALVPLAAWPASPAGADIPDKSGWWWQANSDAVSSVGLAPPAPPDAPQGGLYVAGSTSAPVAVSAIHLSTSTTGGTATLTLHAANGGFSAAPGVVVCPTHSEWSPVEAGSWSQAPKPECDAAGGGVAGTAAGDGSSMTWKLTSAFEAAPGEWNVVVLGGDAPVHVAIDPPGDDAIVVTGGAPADTALGGDALEPAPDGTSTLASPTYDAGPALLPDALSLPGVAGPSAATGGAPAPPPAGRTQPSAGPGTALATSPAAAVPGLHASRRGQRLMAVLLLLAMAAGLWWLGGAPIRAPRRLGALAMAGVPDESAAAGGPDGPLPARGIGRFTRARSGRPPRL